MGARDGSTVIYTPLTQDDRFIVNQGTGVVYLSGEAFDREVQPVVHLLIQARTIDHPVLVAHCIVSVSLEDLNDNAPSFVNKPYEVIASVSAKPGEKLLSIKAIDNDSGKKGRRLNEGILTGSNGMVQYSSSDIPSSFKLNKHDGKITIAGKLEDQKVYKFTVEARDGGSPPLTTSASVKVTVVEKSRPLFSLNKYEAKIQRKTPIGTQVTDTRIPYNISYFRYRQ